MWETTKQLSSYPSYTNKGGNFVLAKISTLRTWENNSNHLKVCCIVICS